MTRISSIRFRDEALVPRVGNDRKGADAGRDDVEITYDQSTRLVTIRSRRSPEWSVIPMENVRYMVPVLDEPPPAAEAVSPSVSLAPPAQEDAPAPVPARGRGGKFLPRVAASADEDD